MQSCNQSLSGVFSEELKHLITDPLYLEKDYNTKILDRNMVYLKKEEQEYLYVFRGYRLLQCSTTDLEGSSSSGNEQLDYLVHEEGRVVYHTTPDTISAWFEITL